MGNVGVKWGKTRTLKELNADWESLPDSPGVYIVSATRALPRAGSEDKAGTLYIGASDKLRSRLWAFWYAEHSASGFLWKYPKVARRLLSDSSLKSGKAVEAALDQLQVRMAKVKDAAGAERALLFAYLEQFGELPPLNSSLPGRWGGRPDSALLAWARKSLRSG